MQFWDDADRAALNALVEAGAQVGYVAYDPVTVGVLGGTSDPEGDALAAGWTEHYREDTARLVEVIYTK